MRLHVGTPIWLIGTPRRQRCYPILRGAHKADVVIVGGGMTGAGIAHVFADAGFRVVLVEAQLVGRGSTAASTALLMQETDGELGSLATRYGHKKALRIWELSRAGSRDLIATIRRLHIPCDLEERASIHYAADPESA